MSESAAKKSKVNEYLNLIFRLATDWWIVSKYLVNFSNVQSFKFEKSPK